ncbi:MAG: DUF4212 domain-containing protein [Betaproteobacteria bacterium HGW-Betaproteobacteria-13]|jgi:putative solute:sodium symporter small subunit|uniref:Sodium symporter small subunit domain-containing protein n=1 Tax=Parazoarcus communis TaxID=41977 RepID=A0A2U8GX06_9RHOO|nr:DUF4212 domain-containing protein [Parazoarcus communis]AWI77930.1 hypothetical protein CEW87_00375 [Parazoarcus communis]PKO80297.1 MAG: DUF4212 domain-containing protein [Betaproteobacteria bacterium HGW-Betaproteobacteria-13]
MELSERHRTYWRRNLMLTGTLLAIWFVGTFVAGYYAVELNSLSFMGFPLGFYVFAQGSLIAYLLIIGIYVRVMNRMDRRYGVSERRS